MHGMFGNLSRVDFRLHNVAAKTPRCNRFDLDGIFLLNDHKLPTYGPAYMHMFMKMAKGWGNTGLKICQCKSPETVEQICDDKITV